MPFVEALDPLTPANTDSVALGDDDIRQKTRAIRERLASFFIDVDTNPLVPKNASVPWAAVVSPATFTPAAHTHPWADITGAPAYATRWPDFSEVTSKPTTIAGYGITDALSNAAHLLFAADNTYNIGAAAANRPANVYAAQYVFAGGGSLGTDTGYVVVRDPSAVNVIAGGSAINYFSNATHVFRSRNFLTTFAQIDNTGLSLQNSPLKLVGGARDWQIGVEAGGGLYVYDIPTTSIRWSWNPSGHYVPGADNTYDIGTAVSRIRNIYLGGAFQAGKFNTAAYEGPLANAATATLTLAQGRYIVIAGVTGAGAGMWLLSGNGAGAFNQVVIAALPNYTFLTSGSNANLTNNSGGTQTIGYAAIKLAD